MPSAAAAVVIPAHDEQERIGTVLRALLDRATPGEFDVLVVCNGCTDGTADVARSVPGVRVAEIERASKIAALREGDRQVTAFPRLYLDGDVVLPTDTARALVAVLRTGRSLVAGVPGRYDFGAANVGVRLFYEFRQRLPVFEEGIIGAGVYGLSERGRQRFEEWPEVLGDDQFVYRLFAAHERAVMTGYTCVEAPPDLRTVVRRGLRVRRGNAELSSGTEAFGSLPAPSAGVPEAIRRSVGSPRGLASVVVFVAVTIAVRVLAKLGRHGDWEAARRLS